MLTTVGYTIDFIAPDEISSFQKQRFKICGYRRLRLFANDPDSAVSLDIQAGDHSDGPHRHRPCRRRAL